MGGCQAFACGDLKSTSAFLSALTTSRASSPSLTPEKEDIRSRALSLLGRSVAPSVSAPTAAYNAVPGAVRTATPSAIAPSAVRGYPAYAPAGTAPTAPITAVKAPSASYYAAGWIKPKPASNPCDEANYKDNRQYACRAAAVAVQGNSMGMSKNTCEWSGDRPVGRQCV